MIGGDGPPVLLLHGYPQTHAMWHKVAPELARDYTVVCAGSARLRRLVQAEGRAGPRQLFQARDGARHGRGDANARLPSGSTSSATTAAAASRTAWRATTAARVQSLTVLDISPTLKMYQSTNMQFAKAYYHWFFLIQEAPLPERMLAGQAPCYILAPARPRAKRLKHFDKRAIAEYVRAFKDPRTIHATCEDYRAAATIDLVHDRKDLRSKTRRCRCSRCGESTA